MWTKWTIKYVDDYRKIRAAQKSDLGPSPFDMGLLGKERWYSSIVRRLFGLFIRAAFWFFRNFWPVPRFGRLVLVARAADVEDVLARPQSFNMPYGLEMRELAGADFMLGIDGPEHAAQRKMVVDAIKPHEDAKLMAELSRSRALRMIEASGGRIDVMKDLITRVASDVCIEYLGLKTEDPDAFAEWTMAMSALLFADWFGDETTRKLALAAAERTRAVVDRSIRLTLDGRGVPDSLLGRLLLARKQGTLTGEVGNESMRAVMIGMATGLVPTNTIGAGKMLEELLRRPDAMQAAKQAARAAEQHDRSGVGGENPHKERLRRILLEAGRLNPALSPGQWRYVAEDAVIGSSWHKRRVEKGCALMVSTMSALRDSAAVRDPGAFRYDREETDRNFMFGDGVHVCIGKRVAMMQITEIFQVLLSQPNLRVASDRFGRMQWTSAFPTRLDMEFDAPEPVAIQQMLTICAPLRQGVSMEAVGKLVEDLQNDKSFSEALDATNLVHFASLNVVEAGDAMKSSPYLVLELNVDGERGKALEAIVARTRAQLGPIFDHTPLGGTDLVATLSNYAIDLETRLWGTTATGLNFNGTPEFSVREIEVQERLAVFARDCVDYFISRRTGIGSRTMPALNFIRFLIEGKRDEALNELKSGIAWNVDEDQDFPKLLVRGAEFRSQLYLPGRKRLQVSDWIERTNEDALVHFLKSQDFWLLASPFLLFALGMAGGIYAWTGGEHDWLSRIIVSASGGLLTMLLVLLLLLGTFVMLLRWHERSDIPDDRDPKLDTLKNVTARENPPGFAQNHFMAVTRMKPGWFRRLTLLISLWGIKQLVLHGYRPGFVLNMGTIHYAKWFLLPQTDKLIFLANYDGSWESYLEDFVMKAHAGQTAAWSNGVGFPKTRLMIYEGAQDGDRFKRWVRRQQVATLFWYSRFPHLTTDQIRNNAVIRQGVARANSESMAQNWLACFGSMQRPDHAIESTEVQSLVFRGFKHSPCAIYALISLPDNAERRAAWLESILPKMVKHDQVPKPGKNQAEPSAADQLASLATIAPELTKEALHISFGDYPFRVHKEITDLATFVAFSSHGLEKLGLSEEGRASFAGVFNMGMANRGRVLGDRHGPRHAAWRWSDSKYAEPTESGPKHVADAILIIYARELRHCMLALSKHQEKLDETSAKNPDGSIALPPKGSIFEIIESQPAKELGDGPFVFREHFGFRDGISQPVIRGTLRSEESVNERDIVEPGEFILGYRNNQGYYPPAIRVGMETDLGNRLPDVISQSPPTFPPYRVADAQLRDFGRNGTFLAVRQIEQHVNEFDEFIRGKAAELVKTPTRGAAGTNVTEEWIAAKMMGRWRSGAPLVLRPAPPRDDDSAPPPKPQPQAQPQPNDVQPEARSKERLEHGHPWDVANDFGYAADDPQGLRCPFGAHIRRANPRDGLKLGDAAQQSITNRHRLLRRGRSYQIERHGNETRTEKGLMFACICTDLERQFEFVQQTWIGSSSFHGLTDEIDPIIGSQHPVIDSKDQTRSEGGRFTIPTPSGPVTLKGLPSFVTVRAGGYFFMPSFSALQYLWDLNRQVADKERTASATGQSDGVVPAEPAGAADASG